ncbi:hypothetical protein ACHAWF_005081, partial [Thalassiosira exigua]
MLMSPPTVSPKPLRSHQCHRCPCSLHITRPTFFIVVFLFGIASYMLESLNVFKQHPEPAFLLASQINSSVFGVTPESRQEFVCGTNATGYMKEWRIFCSWGLVNALDTALREQDKVHIVQIGAHVGFEKNDPIDKGLSGYLNMLTAAQRQNFAWTFVEPSPPNFKRLTQNLESHSDLCDMNAVNAGVVPDSMNNTDSMKFYSLSESIDPETGYDSKSGKTLPVFITQVSSFTLGPIMFNEGQFKRRGLNVWDYIVETNVTTKRYSELMQDIMMHNFSSSATVPAPVLVLIDTEGFDCNIVLGISSNSAFLPPYLIYESHQCGQK